MPYRLAIAHYSVIVNYLVIQGWVVGLEPTTSRTTIWRANQLHHTHHIYFQSLLFQLKRARGDSNPRPTA